MNIEHDIKLDFSDVLIKPKRSTLSSRNDVQLVRNFKPKYGKPFSGIGILSSNMATGTFEMLRKFIPHQMFVAIAKHNSYQWKDEYDKNRSIIDYGFYTIGMSDKELDELKEFYQYVKDNEVVDFSTDNLKAIHTYDNIKICVDIANGYTQSFAEFVSKVRSVFPRCVIVAGNVATHEMSQELIIAGADYIKVGVGSGGNCSTRRQTGIGVPQLSAIIECAEATHALGGGIIADGGIRTPGDVAKALGANADMVMIGGMFAGTKECDGDLIEEATTTGKMLWDSNKNTYVDEILYKKYKIFYGMSSEYAQEKHSGGMKSYRASEGVVSEVEYKGSVSIIIQDLLGSIRSTGTYIGASHIKDFGKCTTFIRVNRVHDRNV